MSRRLLFLVAILVGLAGSAGPVSAQLLSPGRLAAAHSEVEGIRNCVACHQLGQRGISPERCLDCHEALADRIEADRGYHATVPAASCADCHQDHLGADFDLLHLEETNFVHEDTGYLLEPGHADAACRDCHVPANIADAAVVAFKTGRGSLERTYLGLATECSQCHQDDNPHDRQFQDRSCADCHEAVEWATLVGFDHATTRFPLEGLHTEVTCADCHGGDPSNAVYRPLPFASCADCHTDPHAGAMQGTCASCHSTGGWRLLSGEAMGSFDHSRTNFPLRGAHDTSDCAVCHQPGRPPRTELVQIRYLAGTANLTYPRPVAENCASCHVDRHAFADDVGRWLECSSCHSESEWTPSDFGLSRHTEESDFPLTGAHAATPCFVCHEDTDAGYARFTLSIEGRTCVDCHVQDDPHEGQFVGIDCRACHVTEAFDLAEFDHDLYFDPASDQTCASCHDTDDPHAGQFADRDCASCHATNEFLIGAFDHAATSFPLDGAHEGTECASCHTTESDGGRSFVRYRPLGAECADCHGGAL